MPGVPVQRRVQTGQVQAVRRAVQQRQASDVGRDQHSVFQAGRAAVLRRHERAQSVQSQQQAAAAGPGRLQDDAPRRGIPRARGHRDAGGLRSVHGPRFHPDGHAVRSVSFIVWPQDIFYNCNIHELPIETEFVIRFNIDFLFIEHRFRSLDFPLLLNTL